MKNSYIESEEIRKYKIETDNLDEEVMALRGYYYWHCPRCKKIMDSDNNGFVHRCLNCDQAVKYSDKPKTPTLSRMLEVQDDSKLCGEFLDFILSKYTMYEKKQKRESPLMDVMRDCGDYINKEKLLAEFFDIDLDEAEKEKSALLETFRNRTN